MSNSSAMSQDLLGNVFEPGQKGLLCRLAVSPQQVIAVERAPAEGTEPKRLEFPLSAERLSFSGDEGSVILLINPEGAKLYCDRKVLEPTLRELGCAEIQARLGGEEDRVSRQRRSAHAILVGFCFVVLLTGAGLWLLANWALDRAVDRIPVSWENTLGEAVASGLGYPELIDPKIVQPVQAVLDRVLAAAGPHPYAFKLHVVRSPDINAMAAPGGQIIVFTGLLEKTRTPEELAGVLGHEVQHVLGRHSLRNMAHALKWQVIGSVLLGDMSSMQKVLLAKGPELLALSYGRRLEEEADLEGCRLLLRADVDPRGLASFFKILQAQEGLAGSIPEILSSHPETARRIETIEAFLTSNPEADGNYTSFNLDWEAMKRSLAE